MRQPKQVHNCPKCGEPMKRTIGCQTRKKWWECTNEECGHRVAA